MKRYALLVLVCLLSCAPDTTMLPEVTVGIADFTEYRQEFGTVGRAVLLIDNRTAVPVYTAAVSMRLETNSNRYYTTVHEDRGIPPQTKVYLIVEFVYLSPEEYAIEGGIEITDSFFM